MSSKLEIAAKLKELAERGVDGEKETAIRMLERFMKEHNIEEWELEKDEETIYEFPLNKNYYHVFKQLFKQILSSVKETYWCEEIRQNMCALLTVAEYAEVDIKFDFYKKHYLGQLKKLKTRQADEMMKLKLQHAYENENFYVAFIHANELYSIKKTTSAKMNISQEQKDALKKLFTFVDTIEQASPANQIVSGAKRIE